MRFERPNSATFASRASEGAFYNKFLTALEGVLSGQQDQIDAIETLQAQMLDRIAEIEAAQAAADAAQVAADGAQDTADTAKGNDAISASATAPSSILSASDAGSDATISIAGHDRIYGDGSVVTIDPSSIAGLAYSTLYAVYYDDTARTGGAKTFVATTTLKDAQYNKAPGRHFCGQVTTPAAGGGSTSGGPGIPGGGGPYP